MDLLIHSGVQYRVGIEGRLRSTRMTSRNDPAESTVRSWTQWQAAVVQLLRADLAHALERIDIEDVDWAAWRDFYTKGRTPRSAVDRAYERDF